MRVRCKSGLRGDCRQLQTTYADFAEFARYCETFGLHTRLGFHTAEDAWDANPVIESSVLPSDFRISPPYRRKLVMAKLRAASGPESKFRAALDRVNKQYGRALKKLAR